MTLMTLLLFRQQYEDEGTTKEYILLYNIVCVCVCVRGRGFGFKLKNIIMQNERPTHLCVLAGGGGGGCV